MEREGCLLHAHSASFCRFSRPLARILQGVSTHGPAQKRQDPRGESCQGRRGLGEGLEKAWRVAHPASLHYILPSLENKEEKTLIPRLSSNTSPIFNTPSTTKILGRIQLLYLGFSPQPPPRWVPTLHHSHQEPLQLRSLVTSKEPDPPVSPFSVLTLVWLLCHSAPTHLSSWLSAHSCFSFLPPRQLLFSCL